MKKDILFSFITHFIITISMLLSFRLINLSFGNLGFSEYSVIKRNVAFFLPFIIIGFNIAIPRYISVSISKKDNYYPNYFFGAFLIYVLFLTIFSIIYIFKPLFIGNLSNIIFGKSQYEIFIYPLLFTVCNLYLQTIIYSYFRGKIEIKKANTLQIINVGINPILAIFLSNSIVEIYWYYGGLVLICCLPFLTIVHFESIKLSKIKASNIRKATFELFKYGIQRIPGEIGLSGLFTIPVLFATNNFGIEIGGYFAFSMAMIRMTGQIFIPINVVLLPVGSKLLVENKFQHLSQIGIKIIISSVTIAFIIISTYEFFATEILTVYLTTPDPKLIDISKTLFYGTFGYIVYVGLRSIIDAYYKYSMNTISVAVSLLFFFITYYFFQIDLMISFILGTIILVFFTLLFVRKIIFFNH